MRVIGVPYNKGDIIRAVEKAITDEEFLTEVKKCESPYGDGKTGLRIAEILSKVEITPRLLQKHLLREQYAFLTDLPELRLMFLNVKTD